ncbi:MAG: low molecular weight protein-tyrosine-phosphatase [Balneolaceae bacterium]
MKKRAITKDNPYKICFVCLGNICRSPTAEGVMQHLVDERDLSSYFYIDSSGTSAYHIGEPANNKSREVARRYGVELQSRARKFEADDLADFDLILAMDRENLANVKRIANGNSNEAEIMLLRDFDPSVHSGEVPDPYYGGIEGFEKVFKIVRRSCESLLDELEPMVEK